MRNHFNVVSPKCFQSKYECHITCAPFCHYSFIHKSWNNTIHKLQISTTSGM
uniref:Uncharacterized protein n=1 Tax=Arundo donax TaxID=35708 RepID=A0A0A9FTI0_ARUDO